MAVAFVALLATLGGIAVALPGKNKVKKDDIARGAVGKADLAKNAVTNRSVRNRSLTGRKFRLNALGGNAVKESTLGRVPSADFAAGAGNAQNAVNAQNARQLGEQRAPVPLSFAEGDQDAGHLWAVHRLRPVPGRRRRHRDQRDVIATTEENSSFRGDDRPKEPSAGRTGT